MMTGVDLRQLEHFVAVAEEMNFSRGAARAHVVQSAVSTSISKLERELGVELFDRTRRQQIVLTAAGNALLIEARRTLGAARRTRAVATSYHDQLSGAVDLGVLMSSGPLDLPAALGAFHTRHPLVAVRMRQSIAGSTGQLAAVAEGALDLALVAAQSTTHAVLALRPITTEPMVVLCRPDHPLARHDHVDLAALAEHPLIAFAAGWGIRRRTDHAFAQAGLDPTAPYEVSDYDTAAGLVRHRLGVAVLPATPAARYPDLTQRPLHPALDWTLTLATTTDPPPTAATTALIAVLLEHTRATTNPPPTSPSTELTSKDRIADNAAPVGRAGSVRGSRGGDHYSRPRLA